MARRAILAGLFVAGLALAGKASSPASAVPISGVLVDASGAPVPSAMVLLGRRFKTVSDWGFEVLAHAETDRAGKFSFGPVDPNGPLKGLPESDFVTKTNAGPYIEVTTSDHRMAAIRGVAVTPTREKDSSVQSISLKITLR